MKAAEGTVVSRQLRIVDVFSERAFAGNQLAVVLDGRGFSTDLMQRIAREMNFSETTFILPPDDPAHGARLRIFTPTAEMAFAGHPTIGTAWVMATEQLVPRGALEFILEEPIGPVPVRGVNNHGRLTFWMTHPRLSFGKTFDRARVAAAIGLSESYLVPGLPTQIASTGLPFLYVPLRDARAVDSAALHHTRLKALADAPAFGLFLFAAVGPGRLYSRMLADDIHEDPATGSASGPLGALAVSYGLVPRAPKVSLVSEQGTKMGRQSFIHIELTYGDTEDLPASIEVGGSVAAVLSGTLADFADLGA